MTQATDAGPIRATLIDITNCIGCRACQVACKQWNEREGEETELEADLGFQNPATLSAKTYTLIAFHEMENPAKPGGLDSAYVMQRCLHCLEPACVSACPTTALYRQTEKDVEVGDFVRVRLRGTNERMSLYEVNRLTPEAEARLSARSARETMRFAGREWTRLVAKDEISKQQYDQAVSAAPTLIEGNRSRAFATANSTAKGE
jgi:formate hydrogenlyase subunit 6/NADH:ubiquinone oxidoreductase subunit I